MKREIEFGFYPHAKPGENTHIIEVQRARQFVKKHVGQGLSVYVRARGENGRRSTAHELTPPDAFETRPRDSYRLLRSLADFDAILASHEFKLIAASLLDAERTSLDLSSCEAGSYRHDCNMAMRAYRKPKKNKKKKTP